MVFQAIQGAKTGEDAVTSDLDDRAALLTHGRGHGVDHRSDAQHGSLSIDGADGFGRPLDVGEQDGGDLTGRLAGSLNRALDLQGVAAFATNLAPVGLDNPQRGSASPVVPTFLPIPRYTGLGVGFSL